jgi:tetratricopeptide (TPR) repeat protein
MYEQSLKVDERLGDVHGMAQTWGNLGLVYMHKGEYEQAIAMYNRSLGIKEKLGDVYGMAQTWGNLGNFYYAQGDGDRAAHYTAQAYLIFAQLGAAPEAQQAAQQLMDILGSIDAVNAYLARIQEEDN